MQALYRLEAKSGKPALAPAAQAYLKLIRENCSEALPILDRAPILSVA